MTYDDDSSLPGGAYLPLSVKDGNDDCNRYGYDSKGRTTTTFSGLSANASGDCGSSGGREFHRDFNDNGTLDRTWDANSGSSPTDDDKTVYTYWASGDAGYVPGTAGQVKNIRKPGGSCATGSGRRLCTSYTYDGAARVTTVTDGRGIVTRYTYDANDRTTYAYFNNATICGTPLLNPYANCIQYVYDAAGNLAQRFEDSGQTIFDYDRLNRQTIQITPVSGLGQDRIEYTYDAAGNMNGYSQAFNSTGADITTYAYDEANRPTSVTSAVGTFDLDVDEDGRTTGITYPNPNNSFGVNLSYDYTRAGKPTELDWRVAGNLRIATWSYDYTRGGDDKSNLQTRDLDVNGASVLDGKTTYGYDEQRLVSAVRDTGDPYDYEYDYDDVGNITSATANGTTSHYGYNRAGERCWQGPNAGTSAQQLSRTCATGPTGATNLNRDAAGNNTGTTGTDGIVYNERNQVDAIGGTTQDYLDQGNDLRRLRGNERQISGSMGLSATTSNLATTYYTRAPDGQILAGRVGNASWYYISEPNSNVAFITDVNGGVVGGYDYAPYGETTIVGNGDFQPIRWLGSHQDAGTTNDDQYYKLGARYYQTSGAFTQPDALNGGMDDPRTMTAYNYAGGDPINQFDPTGYSWWDDAVDWGVRATGTVMAGAVASLSLTGRALSSPCARGVGYAVASGLSFAGSAVSFATTPFGTAGSVAAGLGTGGAGIAFGLQSYETFQAC